jgi:hypothetical protein
VACAAEAARATGTHSAKRKQQHDLDALDVPRRAGEHFYAQRR